MRPGEEHRIPTVVGTLAVRVIGEGSPAVLWHSLFVDDRSWRRVEDCLARDRRLVIINPAAPNLDNPITLEPLGEGRFRYQAPTGGGPVGEVVRFVEEGGRVVRMVTGDSYVERVQAQ